MYGLVGLRPLPAPRKSDNDGADARMYRRIIERVYAGENYYEAAGSELRRRGYATRPFFNWRLPTLAYFLGLMPNLDMGRWILISFCLLTLLIWFQVLNQECGLPLALFGSLLLFGPLTISFANTGFLFHELWSGVLIALSIAAYARQRWLISYASGFAALGIRELSLPYIFIMLLMAWREKQYRQTLVWLIGSVSFCFFLAYHAITVSNLLTDADVSNRGWIQFGGWSFVLQTATWNAFIIAAPMWSIAIILPLSILGLTGWRSSVGNRAGLTVITYLFAYL